MFHGGAVGGGALEELPLEGVEPLLAEHLEQSAPVLWEDAGPPQVELDVDVAPGTGTVTVRAEDDRQLDSLVVTVDGRPQPVSTTGPVKRNGSPNKSSIVHDVALGPGQHTVTAIAFDRAMRQSELVEQSVTVPGSGGPAPPAPPPPASGSPGPPSLAPGVLPPPSASSSGAGPRAPAKLRVLRAGVTRGRLDVLAEITRRARGTLSGTFRAGGRTSRFEVAIGDNGRIRIARRLPRSQRRMTTGILELRYPGDDDVRPDEVRLRAAQGKAQLRRTRTEIDDDGRLRVAGTISRRARGVVRIRLEFVRPDGSVGALFFHAPIRDGRWAIDSQLPAEAREGGDLSIQYTGYGPRRIRGEQTAKQVTR